jgi:hypothetical protein
MHRNLVTIFSLLLFLAGCESGFPPRSDSSLFGKLPGGSFILHREVSIGPSYAHIVFQGGAAAHGASEFEPRCELEVREVLETTQTIPPGHFRIGKVRGVQRYVSQPGANMLAAAGGAIQLADDSSNEWYMFTYRMQLLSEEQAEPPVLICGGAYNYPFHARYPTLQEMREALGDYATLTLAGEATD